MYGGQAVNLPGHVQHPECDQVAEPSPRSPAMGPLEAEKSAQYAGHLRTRPAMPEGKGSVNGANPDEMPGMWSW